MSTWASSRRKRRLRQEVFERDGGLCSRCGFPCVQLERDLDALYAEHGLEVMLDACRLVGRWGFTREIDGHQVPAYATLDHIVPLCRGGSRRDSTNLRLLCARCHWAQNWTLLGVEPVVIEPKRAPVGVHPVTVGAHPIPRLTVVYQPVRYGTCERIWPTRPRTRGDHNHGMD